MEYGIYDENGNLIKILVIDENGYAKSGKLPYGNYYVKNLSSPGETSYSLSLNDKNKSILYEMDNTQPQKAKSKQEDNDIDTKKQEQNSNVKETNSRAEDETEIEDEITLAETGVNFITSIYLLLSIVTVKLVF